MLQATDEGAFVVNALAVPIVTLVEPGVTTSAGGGGGGVLPPQAAMASKSPQTVKNEIILLMFMPSLSRLDRPIRKYRLSF